MKMSYRKVSNRSEVDDGLFGFRSGTMGSAGRSIVSAEQLSAIRGGGKISNTAVINSADLDRMKRSTLILSTEQIRSPRHLTEKEGCPTAQGETRLSSKPNREK